MAKIWRIVETACELGAMESTEFDKTLDVILDRAVKDKGVPKKADLKDIRVMI